LIDVSMSDRAVVVLVCKALPFGGRLRRANSASYPFDRCVLVIGP